MLATGQRNHWGHVANVAATFAQASVGELVTDADSFPKQWEWVGASSRFNVVMCSRRAGKTRGAVRRAAMALIHGKRVLYINATATNADLQFFIPLKELLRAKGWAFREDASSLLLYVGSRGFLRAVGCNDIGDVKTKLGDGWDEVFVDEMQDQSEEVLKRLIDKAILPMLIDTSGSLHCMGTPPMTRAGFWFDLWSTSTFAKFKWTLMDNPYIDHDWFAPYRERGLTENDPVVRRECFGEIVVDPNSVVFCYEPGRNDIAATGRPEPNHPAWRYSLGMDLGFSDHDAIVVLGWRMDDPQHHLYEVWSWQENHLDYLKLADVFKKTVEKWSPQQICVDTGGHGARKIMESLKAVFSQYRFAMKPASVADSIGLINDEFRTGRLLVNPRGLVAHDAGLCVWKEGKTGVEMSDSFHSDVMAALRYAHSVSYHHQAEAAEPEETDEDRRVRQWLDRRSAQDDPYNPYREGMSRYD